MQDIRPGCCLGIPLVELANTLRKHNAVHGAQLRNHTTFAMVDAKPLCDPTGTADF
jgi:hypothetical protein